MGEDFQVIVEKKILKDMEIYTSVRNSVKADVGILIMTKNIESIFLRNQNLPAIVKFYLIKRKETEYHVERLIEVLEFDILESAIDFLERLPTMSAFDLLLLKNKEGTYHIRDENKIYQ